MKKVYTFLLIITVLIVLPACFLTTPRRLRTPRIVQERVKNDLGLQLMAHILTTNEVKSRFWGVDVEANDLIVIALSMINKGNKHYYFKPSYSSLFGRSADDIAPLFHYDTLARVCWSSVPALIFWWPAIPLFVVPYGYYWKAENQKISVWLSSVLLDSRTYFEIGPYEAVERYLFVNAPAPHNFSFALFDEDAGELVTHHISFVPALEATEGTVSVEPAG